MRDLRECVTLELLSTNRNLYRVAALLYKTLLFRGFRKAQVLKVDYLPASVEKLSLIVKGNEVIIASLDAMVSKYRIIRAT